MNVSNAVRDALLKKYEKQFGRKPQVLAYAPGRVEILGNHTDYNEGYVLSAAINFGTNFAVSPRDDMEAHLWAGDIMEETVFDPANPQRTKDKMWSNYVKGVLAGLNAIKTAPHGFDAMFLGDIPLGSGLSSSAALEISAGFALAKLYGITVPDLEMARIGQKAEHDFAGVKCGLLDQFSAIHGKKDHLVWSDFRTFDVKSVPISPEVCFMLCNTKVRHSLADGDYNERRQRCEQAAAFFDSVLDRKITALRDVSWEEWNRHRTGMDDIVARRSAHPVGENERVLAGIEMLRENNLSGFGKLMFESHNSSRYYFDNSCPELDTIVDAAAGIPGVYGARLSGGGFGGSAVLMVAKGETENVSERVRGVYALKHGDRCDTRVVSCSEGAHVIW